MNRMKVAVCISALATLVCMAGYLCVHTVVAQTIRYLDETQSAAMQDDYIFAAQHSAELADYYDAHVVLLSFFTKREQLSAINVSLHGLRAYASVDNASDFHTEVDKARAQLRMLEGLFTGPF